MELHRNKQQTTSEHQQLSNKQTIRNMDPTNVQYKRKQTSTPTKRHKFIIAAFISLSCHIISLARFKSSDSSVRRGVVRSNTSPARTETNSDTHDLSPINTNFKQNGNPLLAPGKYVHPNIIYGTVHMAKTGGTSLNGMLANKFERVCGHKGYTYDAYRSNENVIKNPESIDMKTYNRDRVDYDIMEEIGYENCDYISHEIDWNFWVDNFGNGAFHGTPMELHVPCRDPIDHLMSQCNYRRRELDCDGSEESFLISIDSCFLYLGSRYNHALKKQFQLKCFDFQTQFTDYVEYMSERLQSRRFVSKPYVQRETNDSRDKEKECIWKRPDLMERARAHMMKWVDYYQFCAECMGSENEIIKKSESEILV